LNLNHSSFKNGGIFLLGLLLTSYLLIIFFRFEQSLQGNLSLLKVFLLSPLIHTKKTHFISNFTFNGLCHTYFLLSTMVCPGEFLKGLKKVYLAVLTVNWVHVGGAGYILALACFTMKGVKVTLSSLTLLGFSTIIYGFAGIILAAWLPFTVKALRMPRQENPANTVEGFLLYILGLLVIGSALIGFYQNLLNLDWKESCLWFWISTSTIGQEKVKVNFTGHVLGFLVGLAFALANKRFRLLWAR